MAEQITPTDERYKDAEKALRSSGVGNSTKYPWDEWMDGNIWQVEYGVDFNVGFASFVTGLHQRASKFGMKVTTRRIDNRIIFKFMPIEGADSE